MIPEELTNILRKKSSKTRIAVVGASNDPEKYGNIIVKNLKNKGYSLLPVNPKEDRIADLEVTKKASLLKTPVDVLNFVTPPKVTRMVLETLDSKDFPVLWFQDGSFDSEIVAFAESRFDTVIHHACIMVVTNYPA